MRASRDLRRAVVIGQGVAAIGNAQIDTSVKAAQAGDQPVFIHRRQHRLHQSPASVSMIRLPMRRNNRVP